MLPKNALILILSILLAFVVFLFYLNNRELLSTALLVMGLPFRLVKLWVASLLVTAAVPTAIFSYRYYLKSRLLKAAQATTRALRANRAQIEEIENLLELGAVQAAKTAIQSLAASRDKSRLEGQLRLMQGQFDRAIACLQPAFETQPDAEVGFKLAEAYAEIGRDQAADDVIKRIITAYPQQALTAYRHRLKRLEAKRLWSEALDCVQALEKEQPEFYELKSRGFRFERVSAMLAAQPGDKGAREQLGQLVTQFPDFVPALLLQGDDLMASGDAKRAFDVFERGYRKTEHPVFLSRMEDYYLEQGRPEDALQVYRRLVASDQGIAAVFQLAKLYRKLEMNDECLELLRTTFRSSNRIPALRVLCADLHARRELFQEAYAGLRPLLDQTEISASEYRCHNCDQAHELYHDRCEACGEWGNIDLDIKLRPQAAVASAPVYS